MGKRLKKMYVRDENKVFRAVPGFEYSETLVFIDTSVYTIASQLSDSSVIVLKKKVKK